jgi:hypothetical protein
MEPREEKDISIVTTGRVKTRKGGGLASEIRNIGNSLFAEIIMPAMKGAVLDFFNDGLRMAMFGRDDINRRGSGRHTAYNRMHKKRGTHGRDRDRRSSNRNVRQTEEIFEDIFFDDRNDAENVLGRMMELIAEYGWATIGDLYSLVGLSANYTHERYGWDDLRRCRVQFTSEGYVIDLPEPDYLK